MKLSLWEFKTLFNQINVFVLHFVKVSDLDDKKILYVINLDFLGGQR